MAGGNSTTTLANLYRPKTFADVVGQPLAVTTLKRIAHADGIAARAIFIKGAFGSGKTTTARIFARALNCDTFKQTDDVCNTCDGCLEASSVNSSTYWELDGTVIGNVEGIRALKERLSIVPNGRRVVCLDEVQSCLYYNTPVVCVSDDGSIYRQPIHKIVNNRLPVKVLSVNAEGGLCVSRVTGWFKNPLKQLCRIKVRGASGLKKIGSGSRVIVCTLDHRFLRSDGEYVCASDLHLGDSLSSFFSVCGDRFIQAELNKRTEYIISDSTKSFLYGSLLGDMYFSSGDVNYNYRLKCTHGHVQLFWLREKHRILGCLAGALREFVSSPGAYVDSVSVMNSLSHPLFTEMARVCCGSDGKRHVNMEWLSHVDEIGLAAWFMDDGSYHFRRLRNKQVTCLHGVQLSTHSFTYEENELLVKWLSDRWGLDFYIMVDKRCGKPYLVSSHVESARKFLALVAPFLCKEFQYKLGNTFEAGDGVRSIPAISKRVPEYFGGFLFDGVVESIEIFDPPKYSSVKSGCLSSENKYPYDNGWVYDLEVADTHSYIAGRGFVVHNCSRSASDALLKVVEEGVPNTIFLFCGTEDIQPTLKSRCVNIDISVIPLSLIADRVRFIANDRGISITDDQLRILAMKSQGHMRDALQLLQFYELAGERALDSSYFLFREFVRSCFAKGADPSSVLPKLLVYSTADIKMSVGLLIRNIFGSAQDDSLESKFQRAGLGQTLFSFFFSPLAQQALGSEIGTEILLRSLMERTAGSRKM